MLRSRFRRFVTGVLSGLFLSLGIATLSANEPNDSNGDSVSIFQQTDQAISAVSRYLASGTDRTDQILRAIGYRPSIPVQNWNALPAIHKLQLAYTEAESARSGSGEQMLARLSRNLAMQYEAAGYEPHLARFRNVPAAETFTFRPAPTPRTARIRLPANVEKAIGAIARYSDGGALGGASGILTNHFGLSPDRAYDILRDSPTNEEALRRGMAAVPPEARPARLARTVAAVQDVYDGARYDAALNAIHRDPRWSGQGDAPASRAVNPSFTPPGGEFAAPPRPTPADAFVTRPRVRGPSRSAVGETYRSYRRTNYPTAAARRFGTMSRGTRGFGGVVFGNRVIDDPTLPTLRSLSWIPGRDASQMGRLLFRFADGSERIVGPILHEDVFAAYAIAYDGVAGVQAAEESEGIGLVGIHDAVPYFVLESGALTSHGRQWQIVMHPAIAQLDLGWSTLYVDVLPIAAEQLVSLVRRNGTADDLRRVQAVFTGTPDTWKVTDAPLRVFDDAGQLGVERVAESGRSYSTSLRREAFIAVEGFVFDSANGETLTPEFSDAFYRVVPALIRSSHDYDRLNEFAKVLALLRWAKGDGAAFYGAPKVPPPVPTPGTIIVDTDAIVPSDAVPADEIYGRLGSLLPTSGRLLAVGRPVARTLTTADMTWTDETPAQPWELMLQAGAVVTIDLQSGDFDAYLHLLGPGLACILTDDDGGDGVDAKLTMRAPETGSYWVVVNSLGEGGNFRLSARASAPTGLSDCDGFAGTISLGETITGVLTDRDEMLADSTYAQSWQLHGESGQSVTIDLVSTAFDAYLILHGPELDDGISDDDGGGACNARITVTFPSSGRYLVLVNTAAVAETGSFTLRVSRRPPPKATGVCR